MKTLKKSILYMIAIYLLSMFQWFFIETKAVRPKDPNFPGIAIVFIWTFIFIPLSSLVYTAYCKYVPMNKAYRFISAIICPIILFLSFLTSLWIYHGFDIQVLLNPKAWGLFIWSLFWSLLGLIRIKKPQAENE